MLDVLLTSGMERWEAALEGKWRELILMSRPYVLEAEGCGKLFKGLGEKAPRKLEVIGCLTSYICIYII